MYIKSNLFCSKNKVKRRLGFFGNVPDTLGPSPDLNCQSDSDNCTASYPELEIEPS